MPRDACSASISPAFEMGFVEAVIVHPKMSIDREFGDSDSLCSGIGTDSAIFQGSSESSGLR